ncbi:MAG: hypothetical protein ABS81_06070 [Pseudonocardia sp. SCN 72-86]|nr:MAG: hypothetical protein ABS81_06070 [Pseudonocardia sp. SCN 72-86]
MFSEPKARASAAGVGLLTRVVSVLEVQAMRQQLERDGWGEAYEDQRLVFARENGAPSGRSTCSSGSARGAARPGFRPSGYTTSGTRRRR